MEEKQTPIVRITLGYGVILAIVVIIYSLIVFLLDADPQSVLNYFSFAFVVAGIIIAQFNYRNKHLGGFISYGNAFKVGLLTIIRYSILLTVYTYIFYIYIDPGSIEEIRNLQEEKMIGRGMSDLEIDETLKIMEPFQSPLWYTLSALIGNIIIGTILSLITAIFVKKEDQSVMPPV